MANSRNRHDYLDWQFVIAPGRGRIQGREHVPANERPHPLPTPRALPVDQDTIDAWYRNHPRANGNGRAALRTARAKQRAQNAKHAKTGRAPTSGVAPPSAARKFIGGNYND